MLLLNQSKPSPAAPLPPQSPAVLLLVLSPSPQGPNPRSILIALISLYGMHFCVSTNLLFLINSQMSIVMRVERPNTGAAKPDPYMGYESTSKSLPYGEESNLDESKKIEYGKDGGVYGSAMIHDFCFGIPFGGLVLSGGLIGLLFSRSTATFSGLLIGGGLLALSSYSLKIWRQGKSSLPFVFGQAVLAAALLWKNIEAYSLTKSLLPAGIFATISAAMLCFYIHVMVSGGNPPPKKLHSSTSRT
ncbi:Protein FATTY ACID EXPORT 1, chloroplastic [Linum perenne]